MMKMTRLCYNGILMNLQMGTKVADEISFQQVHFIEIHKMSFTTPF